VLLARSAIAHTHVVGPLGSRLTVVHGRPCCVVANNANRDTNATRRRRADS
jgi:hypothetical protein